MLCSRYQQLLHRNLVYLASIADANQNIQALLPVSVTYLFAKYLIYDCADGREQC